jgi:hypothetical protein
LPARGGPWPSTARPKPSHFARVLKPVLQLKYPRHIQQPSVSEICTHTPIRGAVRRPRTMRSLLRQEPKAWTDLLKLCRSTDNRVARTHTQRCYTQLEYRASVAQWKSELLARRPKPAKLVTNPRLRKYVQDRLEGSIHDARGREVSGPGRRRSLAATNLTAAIASGSMAGRQSRLLTDCGSTSPMILQCASRTKPSAAPILPQGHRPIAVE